MNQTESINLEAVFRQATKTQPDLTDANFTKVVVNRLSSVSQEPAKQGSWFPDLVGILVALCAILLIVEPSNIAQIAQSIVPERLVISAPNVLAVTSVLMISALLGWIAVERGA